MSWCRVMMGMCSNTTQECDENLFCHPQYSTRYNITTSGVTHYYCSLTKRRSTGVYDDIGRTDETTKTVTATQNKASESLIQCEVNYGSWPGLYCDHQCKVMKDWCTGERLSFYKSAACNVDGNLIQRNDQDLCNDNLFWRGKGCFVKEYITSGFSFSDGYRCYGSNQQCFYPWYSFNILWHWWVTGWERLGTTCEDMSDQVMQQHSTCPDRAVYLQIHNDEFPDYNKWAANNYEFIYVDKYEIQYNEKYQTNRSKEFPIDPHNCWQSCSVPGPGCSTCTNENYFTCPKSGVCIPQELVCDGHPQCLHGEDEDVDTCFQSWVSRRLVSPAASLRCSSKRYPGTPTLSVPCDGIVECYDGADEVSCKKQTLSTYLLAGAIAFVVIVYLLLKCCRKHKDKILDSSCDKKDLNEGDHSFGLMKKLTKVNTHLFNAVHSMKVEESEQICKDFYSKLANIHGNDEAEIYRSLHNFLDPAMAAAVVNAKTRV